MFNPSMRVGIESGDSRAEFYSSIIVAGVQTLGREGCNRIPWLNPSLIITDEAHHSPADSYCTIYRRYGVFSDEWQGFHLGVTATPHRMDNRPIHGDEDAIYEELVYQYTLRQAIKDGFLCDLRGYRSSGSADLTTVKTTAGDYNLGQLQAAMNTSTENELAFKSWSDVARDRPTIVFCAGVEHAKDVAEVFRAHGVKAASVDGTMRKDDRERVMSDFKAGKIQVLTNMDIATEGFDHPPTSCILMLRPTQSWSLYQQMVGRGLRLSEGKQDCIVIDVVGIAANPNAPKKEGKKPVCLSTLVDLPEIDLEGHTLMEAVELFEDLTDAQRAHLFKRPTNFKGLSPSLQQVDMLAELETPDEIRGFTTLAWLKIGDGNYALRCGPDPGEGERFAHLTCDALGRYSLRLNSKKRDDLLALSLTDVSDAMRTADSICRQEWPDLYRYADTRARWRSEGPTDKQVSLMAKLGVEADVIRSLNKGQASLLITKLFDEKAGKR